MSDTRTDKDGGTWSDGGKSYDPPVRKTLQRDTGWWFWRHERWFVVQRENGGIVADSEDGSFTAASESTWNSWKKSGFWIKCESNVAP